MFDMLVTTRCRYITLKCTRLQLLQSHVSQSDNQIYELQSHLHQYFHHILDMLLTIQPLYPHQTYRTSSGCYDGGKYNGKYPIAIYNSQNLNDQKRIGQYISTIPSVYYDWMVDMYIFIYVFFCFVDCCLPIWSNWVKQQIYKSTNVILRFCLLIYISGIWK